MATSNHQDIRISNVASSLLKRYGYRLTAGQLAEYLGLPLEDIRLVPHDVLPRMSINKLGTIFFCLDAAAYIVNHHNTPHIDSR